MQDNDTPSLHPTFTPALLSPRYWHTWLGLGLMWLLSWLPWRLQMLLGKWLGRVLARVATRRRRICEINLALCFPELDATARHELMIQNFESTAQALFENSMAWFWPRWRLRRLVRYEGLENLEALKTRAGLEGKGVLMMALHFTTLDIGAALLGLQFPFDGMYRRHDNPVFDYVQRRGRGRMNAHRGIITIEREDIRLMLSRLKHGHAVWYAPDQDYGRRSSVFVPFFGNEAATVTATTRFARSGKAVVVPFVQTRLADGSGYCVTVYPAWENFPGSSMEEDALRVNQYAEREIRRQPAQYLWAHRRFKTQVEGKVSPYK